MLDKPQFLGRNSSFVFGVFLGKLKTPKHHSEINWPLVRLEVPLNEVHCTLLPKRQL